MKFKLALILFLICRLCFAQELVDAEGFFTSRGGFIKFFEIKDTGAYPMHAIFDVTISTDSLNSILEEEYKVKVKYVRSGKPYIYDKVMRYDEIIIKEINAVFPEYEIWKYGYGKLLTIKEPVIAEGFLSKGFEHHSFAELKNDTIVASGCLFFDNYSGDEKDYLAGSRSPEIDCYIKVKGTRIYGPLQYCNRTGSYFAIHVDEIIELDESYNFHDFAMNKIKTSGQYITENDSLLLPDDFEIGRAYFFESCNSKPKCTLKIIRTHIDKVDYTLQFQKQTKHYKNKTGSLVPSLYSPGYNRIMYRTNTVYVNTPHKNHMEFDTDPITLDVEKSDIECPLTISYFNKDEMISLSFKATKN